MEVHNVPCLRLSPEGTVDLTVAVESKQYYELFSLLNCPRTLTEKRKIKCLPIVVVNTILTMHFLEEVT